DHAHVLVVEDEHLDGEAELTGGAELLDVHLDRGLAGDVDHQPPGVAELGPDGSGKAVAHRAKPAAGEPAVGLVEAEVLRRPHLVLADLRGDDGVVLARQLVEPLDRVLRHDRARAGALWISEALAGLPAGDARLPFREVATFAGAPGADQLLEHRGAIADDAEIDRDDLVDRGTVDVDVDLPRSRREGVEASGDAVDR